MLPSVKFIILAILCIINIHAWAWLDQIEWRADYLSRISEDIEDIEDLKRIKKRVYYLNISIIANVIGIGLVTIF